MKKTNSIYLTLLIILSALAPVNAQNLNPTSHDFGDVVVGESATTTITLFNNGFSSIFIDAVSFSPDIADFSRTTSHLLPDSFDYLESLEVYVTFTPSSVGEFYALLVIRNGEEFLVPLLGTGVPSNPTTVIDIIDFINESVSTEALEGAGAGASADGRLGALINMLNQASDLINAGDYEAACDQLNAALKRCDDFVEGTAQDELKQMISDIMNELGC